MDQKKPSNTKDLILQAGCKAISEKSYHACGLKEILDIAGVPKGSFYHYFKSKEDFGVQLIEAEIHEYSNFIRESLTNRQYSPIQRLRNLLNEKRSFYIEGDLACDCVLPKMALELSQLSPTLRAAIKCGYDTITAQFAQVIREAQAEDEILNQQDADFLATMINYGWQGVAIRVQIEQSIQPVDDYIEFILTTILGVRIA
ncbi:TetR/AcrR family transcriptional regulator [Algicola sagamiensis]|uniref:TetR/AcrR family transcriptional regulator n=1 Tax=Algicola sagamiensis TaxID=163869 RepID=UPI00036951EF|nr:TetR/AcrR family transcriptional regulator [Algicola sagamiensis]